MKIVEKRTKRTFTLEDISEEEIDMLRVFADRARLLGDSDEARAAGRFLKMTEKYASGGYNPVACFNE